MRLFFIAYFDFEIIKKSLESLYGISGLNITVIENKSPLSELKIKPYFLNELKEKRINRYYFFENNLANNALEIVIANELNSLKNEEFFIITDGDLLVKNADWFIEEMNIMQTNNNLFSCAISLNLDNLPISTFPEAINWLPPNINETDQYYENLTGAHLLMIRTSDFLNYWSFREKRNLNFTDGSMAHFCYQYLRKKWARTKKNEAIHLTWDSYADLDHPYTKLRLLKTHKETWYNKKYWSIIRLYESNGQSRVFIDWKRTILKQIPADIINTLPIYGIKLIKKILNRNGSVKQVQ